MHEHSIFRLVYEQRQYGIVVPQTLFMVCQLEVQYFGMLQ